MTEAHRPDEPQFKSTSRPAQNWPPDLPGYVHMMSVLHRGYETAYYCCAEQAHEVTDLLVPHLERVETMLRAGMSLESVVAKIRGKVAETDPGADPAGTPG